ncbi:MAG: hypothetical protein ACOYIG_09380 [Acetivibrionales bacterium]|jgi:hypothetical protein
MQVRGTDAVGGGYPMPRRVEKYTPKAPTNYAPSPPSGSLTVPNTPAAQQTSSWYDDLMKKLDRIMSSAYFNNLLNQIMQQNSGMLASQTKNFNQLLAKELIANDIDAERRGLFNSGIASTQARNLQENNSDRIAAFKAALMQEASNIAREIQQMQLDAARAGGSLRLEKEKMDMANRQFAQQMELANRELEAQLAARRASSASSAKSLSSGAREKATAIYQQAFQWINAVRGSGDGFGASAEAYDPLIRRAAQDMIELGDVEGAREILQAWDAVLAGGGAPPDPETKEAGTQPGALSAWWQSIQPEGYSIGDEGWFNTYWNDLLELLNPSGKFEWNGLFQPYVKR